MVAPIQSFYRRHLQRQWPGTLARPNEPHAFDPGSLHVPANGNMPFPGEAVMYDAGEDSFRLPGSDAEELLVVGVLGYNPGDIPTVLQAPPAMANSDTQIQYSDNAVIKVCVFGTFNVLAGSAMEYGDSVIYDHQTRRFIRYAGPNVGVAPQLNANPSQANVNAALNGNAGFD